MSDNPVKPVKHQDKRSVPARCVNCRFWLRHEGTKDGEEFGECKRFPPVWVIVEGEMEQSCPLTNPLDWCGEFQVRHDA